VVIVTMWLPPSTEGRYKPTMLTLPQHDLPLSAHPYLLRFGDTHTPLRLMI